VKKNILIIGATSGIAQAVARIYASQYADIFLVARNNEKLQAVSADLIARGAGKTGVFIMDANDSSLIMPMLDMAWKDIGNIDIALVAHGSLVDQKRSESDILYAISEFRTNAESVISCLSGLANRFEQQGSGVIAVIGSVAGDRGRGSNYLYGSAKAAIDTYASGLRARLFKSGVHVMVIKPGFVATPMTAQLDLPELLTSTPERVARDIQRAITRNQDVLYTPWFWKWIMLIIRWIPAVIFKRMKL
jgi:decaprenylphospho-beta-D-erythro-pentofuranosid-2-ulose 2-reductase